MASMSPPLPPFELASRVGTLENTSEPWEMYEAIGLASREHLLASLPDGFSMEGKRVLDFGCGAGRTLRQFVDYPAEFWGCDIDAASIDWMRENLAPPLHPFVNGELPPLDQADAAFDLVFCVSVFTHLSRSWSAWLVELHRVLKPGGILFATFMGEAQSESVAGEPWNEDAVGMLTLRPGQAWSEGGPMILHSRWWIGEHWGRLFDIVAVHPSGFPCLPRGAGQGFAVMRKREASLTAAELEVPGGDPREAIALAHNVDRLVRELEDIGPTSGG